MNAHAAAEVIKKGRASFLLEYLSGALKPYCQPHTCDLDEAGASAATSLPHQGQGQMLSPVPQLRMPLRRELVESGRPDLAAAVDAAGGFTKAGYVHMTGMTM